jgi:mono/diheme cytochrome c family protein
MSIRGRRLLSLFLLAALTSPAGAQAPAPRTAKPGAPPGVPAPIRVTMEELHAQGGVPRGWKFLLPRGDAAEGRKVFVALECFACHEVKGEDFPQEAKTSRGPGPELTGMGVHHPAEYLAESILNPNRVIIKGTGYTGPDGLSRMPSYADVMTLKQLVDLVAYLTSLTGGQMEHGGHDMKMK